MTGKAGGYSRRHVLAGAGSLTVAALAGCSGGGDGGGNGNGNGNGDNGDENGDEGDDGPERTEGATVINVQASQFSPPVVEVEQGTTVRWEQRAAAHTVTFYHEDNGRQHRVPEGVDAFDVDVNPGDEFQEFTFEVPGVYDYFCDLHEVDDQQIGSVVVPGNDDPDQPGLQEPGDDFEPFAARQLENLNEQAREMLGI